MKLEELSSCLAAARLYGNGGIEITDLQADSRRVKPGDLFICLPGFTVDGHDFAPQAASSGAVALVVERKLELDLPQIVVDDSRFAMSVLSNAFFKSPSSRMKMIGVTGTNGKTTTTYLIERIMEDHGVKPGLIGTIQMRYGGGG
ncbi:Mur ligase domain-containing protein, partial [Paenibacillus zanthoxyli]|uniref:Mur ligase domain-containing protein n=1 Tax=Paenibacillus zanthoxyli TaxID=369399 RepID=UPI0005674955